MQQSTSHSPYTLHGNIKVQLPNLSNKFSQKSPKGLHIDLEIQFLIFHGEKT